MSQMAREDLRQQYDKALKDLGYPDSNYVYLYPDAEVILDGQFTRAKLRQIIALVDGYAMKAAKLSEA